MLDLQQLRYFVAVAETENVGRAADRLGVSQSPLSRQVLGLEAKLGLSLFARSRKRLHLTRDGREFLESAQGLLAHADRAERRARDLASGAAGTLAVGFVDGAVHSGALGRDLRAFHSAVPAARLELYTLRSGQQFEALKSGAIDVGYAYAPGIELASDLVSDEGFLLAAPANDPLKKFDAAALDGRPFIALPEAASPEARQAFLSACRQVGFVPDIRFEAVNPTTVLGLVGAGLGYALAQESLARTAPEGVAFIPLPSSFSWRVRIYRVTSPSPSRRLATRYLNAAEARRDEP